jgi:hypothetical protein
MSLVPLSVIATEIIRVAEGKCLINESECVGTMHLLAALHEFSPEVLGPFKISDAMIDKAIAKNSGLQSWHGNSACYGGFKRHWGISVKKIVTSASDVAKLRKDDYVTPYHLYYALLSSLSGDCQKYLSRYMCSVDIDRTARKCIEFLQANRNQVVIEFMKGGVS